MLPPGFKICNLFLLLVFNVYKQRDVDIFGKAAGPICLSCGASNDQEKQFKVAISKEILFSYIRKFATKNNLQNYLLL